MPYPLGGTQYVVTSITEPPLPQPVKVPMTVTRTWPLSVGGNITPRFRTVSVITEAPAVDGSATTARVSLLRKWNGVGGTVSQPSFPQLDKNETVYPRAR